MGWGVSVLCVRLGVSFKSDKHILIVNQPVVALCSICYEGGVKG